MAPNNHDPKGKSGNPSARVSAQAKIKVVGVGGGGGNAVNTMIRTGLSGVEFIVANTDTQVLEASPATVKLQLGQELTRGLGAGANPEVGQNAALEDAKRIAEALTGADLVFITAGMGGGTGTGAAPVFARIAKEVGALTVSVMTRPFQFEGKKRYKAADQGIARIREHSDLLIIIPNQRLLSLSTEPLSMMEAFKKADEVLLNAVQGIADLVNHTGLVNNDFAHVKTVMKNKGLALMGLGYASGENRAVLAAQNAISSPLLEDTSIKGATGIIINISAASDLSIHEVSAATSLIMEIAHEDADIIFGTVIDESLGDRVKVTVVATGLAQERVQEMPLPFAGPIHLPARPAAVGVVPASGPVLGATAAALAEEPFEEPSLEPEIPDEPVIRLAPTPPPAPEAKAAPSPAARVSAEPVASPPPAPKTPPAATAPASAASGSASASVSASAPASEGRENKDLARARALAEKLGITEPADPLRDLPAFARKPVKRES